LLQTGVGGEERLPLDSKNPANCFSGVEECRFAAAAGDVRNSEQGMNVFNKRYRNKFYIT